MIHLDTHVIVWLAGGWQGRLPASAHARLGQDAVRVSPMVQLELAYLHEIGRITRGPDAVLAALMSSIGLDVSTAPFGAVVAHAVDLTWTRDPFDRLIVANALLEGAELLTADESILAHCPAAFWGEGPAPGLT